MLKHYFVFNFFRTSLIIVVLAICCPASYAAIDDSYSYDQANIDLNRTRHQQSIALILAEVDCINDPSNKECEGLLIIPGEEKNEASEKKCTPYCKKFGKQCNVDFRGQRRCIRMCQEFAEECI